MIAVSGFLKEEPRERERERERERDYCTFRCKSEGY